MAAAVVSGALPGCRAHHQSAPCGCCRRAARDVLEDLRSSSLRLAPSPAPPLERVPQPETNARFLLPVGASSPRVGRWASLEFLRPGHDAAVAPPQITRMPQRPECGGARGTHQPMKSPQACSASMGSLRRSPTLRSTRRARRRRRQRSDGGQERGRCGRSSAFLTADSTASADEPRPLQRPKPQPRPQSCSLNQVRIDVFTLEDILRRGGLPIATTAVLVLHRNLTLPSTLRLNGAFSCTVFRCAAAPGGCSIHSTSTLAPAVLVRGAHHVLFVGIHIHGPPPVDQVGACPFKLYKYMDEAACPALAVASSLHIHVVLAIISGAVHVFDSRHCLLDSLHIVSEDYGVVVGGKGVTERPDFQLMHNTISNNVIQGKKTGVHLAYGAVGVSVLNNDIRDFFKFGIYLGRGIHNTGDSMHNLVKHNYLFTAPHAIVDSDGGGLYAATHWLNPGNKMECNYVIGPMAHCIYLDIAASGVALDGTVCVGQRNSMKMNTGHANHITGHLTIVPRYQPGFIMPQLLWNCIRDPGSYWNKIREQYWDSPSFQAEYPWLTDFCDITEIGGFSCNQETGLNASSTGNCSGMPTLNSVVVASRTTRVPAILHTDQLPALPWINNVSFIEYRAKTPEEASAKYGLDFIDMANGDWGLRPSSRILQDSPGFRSCPRQDVGPRLSNATAATTAFFGILCCSNEGMQRCSQSHVIGEVLMEGSPNCRAAQTRQAFSAAFSVFRTM
eukprot:SM000104S09364  [mRNA]  locus=s104:386271:389445:+ [translate_table: standard]